MFMGYGDGPVDENELLKHEELSLIPSTKARYGGTPVILVLKRWRWEGPLGSLVSKSSQNGKLQVQPRAHPQRIR